MGIGKWTQMIEFNYIFPSSTFILVGAYIVQLHIFFSQSYKGIWEYNELFQDFVNHYFWKLFTCMGAGRLQRQGCCEFWHGSNILVVMDKEGKKINDNENESNFLWVLFLASSWAAISKELKSLLNVS